MKSIIHPSTGRRVFFGRNPPTQAVRDRPRLFLADYVTPALPTPPAGPLGRVAALQSVVAQEYGNDGAGDCTKAAQAKLIGGYTGLANPPATIFQTPDILADYYRETGGQDTGLDLITVLEDWRDNPKGFFAPHKIDAFMTVDASNIDHVKLAIWAFLGTYGGASLPGGWVTPMPSASGFKWGIAGDPDPESGHCMPQIDYNADGVITLTWGMWGTITWAALAKYFSEFGGGELHVPITQEIINHATKLCPAGIDYASLQSDVAEIGQIAAKEVFTTNV